MPIETGQKLGDYEVIDVIESSKTGVTYKVRNMLLQRQLDNRGFQLNRQGKIPFALGSEGHEALQAGAAMAFDVGLSHPDTFAGVVTMGLFGFLYFGMLGTAIPSVILRPSMRSMESRSGIS